MKIPENPYNAPKKKLRTEPLPVVKFFKNIKDEWEWNVTHPNGKITGASSESYKNKTDCISNLRNLVRDLTEVFEQESQKPD